MLDYPLHHQIFSISCISLNIFPETWRNVYVNLCNAEITHQKRPKLLHFYCWRKVIWWFEKLFEEFVELFGDVAQIIKVNIKMNNYGTVIYIETIPLKYSGFCKFMHLKYSGFCKYKDKKYSGFCKSMLKIGDFNI